MPTRMKWEKRGKEYQFHSKVSHIPPTPIYVSDRVKAIRAEIHPGLRPCAVPYCWKFVGEPRRFCSYHVNKQRFEKP